MSFSPLTVALAPIMVALFAALTFVASMGPDGPEARTEESLKPVSASSIQVSPSVTIPRPGVSGSLVSGPEKADIDHDGVSEALSGTERGFYRIVDGEVAQHIPTSTEVRSFALVSDITGDGVDDVALALGDTTFPNIRLYDSVSGEEIWNFIPSQDVFLDNLMWTSQQTSTFDLLSTDIDSDGSPELFATSGYRLYALDAVTGEEKWRYEWLDNLWRVAAIDDIDGDGVIDLAVGSQDGYLIAVNGVDGALIWKSELSLPFDAIDEKGAAWKRIARSVWDIIPLSAGSGEAIVTAEDGYVRNVDMKNGDVSWQIELVTQPEAPLSEYYRQRSGNPTGPGASHFFNLRAMQVPDISGDGFEDLIVTSNMGIFTSQDSRNSGIFTVDSASGDLIWRNSTTDVSSVASIDIFESDGDWLLAVPTRSPVFLDLVTGAAIAKGPFDLPASTDNGREGGNALLALGGADYFLATATGDLTGMSGDFEWSIPRVTQSQFVRGDFTGDEADDVLVWSGGVSSSDFGVEPRSRLVYLIDGTTGELAWEYLVPHDLYEATGGIAGIKAMSDLTGDGKLDVIGYMQDSKELNGGDVQTPGANSRVLVLDGATGSEALNAQHVQADYYGIWDLVYNEDPGLVEMVRSQVADRIGGNLENEWFGEQQNLVNSFESGLEQRWSEHRLAQVQQFVAQNGGGGSDEELRQQNAQLMDSEWSAISAERSTSFEANLTDESDALRAVGADESLISLYENRRRADFDVILEQERLNQYAQWESEFEHQLSTGQLGATAGQSEFESELDSQRANIEQLWRDEFESSLESQRTAWIDSQTGGSLDSEAQMEIANLRQQLESDGGWHKIDKRIISVDVISYPETDSGKALLIAGPRDLFIVTLDGELIWTRSYDAGVYDTPFGSSDFDMSFGIPVDNNRPVRTVADRNGDGFDDLRLSFGASMVFAESVVTDGELSFVQTQSIVGPAGSDGNGAATEIPDLNLDGVPDVALIHWRDNAPPEATIVDGVTGLTLLRLDNFDENSVTLSPTEDFNGDAQPDVFMFERWVDGREGPRLRILASGSGATLWEFLDFRDLNLIDEARYNGPIIPATAVGDMTGDGIPEVAVVRHLTWQQGGSIEVFDTSSDELVSQVITEEIDPNSTQEKRWHPGMLASQVGDLNGDGFSEIAYVTAFGSGGHKESRLGVADLASGDVIADFSVTGASLTSLDSAGKFGLAGFSGDLFLLDVSNELSISLPGGSSEVTSPLKLEWEGAANGSFNQVFVDGIEVARTNDEAVELNLRSGDHTVAVRSIDPNGRGIIATSDISVSKSQAARNIALAVALLVVLGTFWIPGKRLFERSRVRMATSG